MAVSSLVCVWREGVVYCALIVYPADRAARAAAWRAGAVTTVRCVAVTNNGETWSARAFNATGDGRRIDAAILEGLDGAMGSGPSPARRPVLRDSLVRTPPEYRLPVEWAKRTVKEVGKAYFTVAGKVAESATLPRASGVGEISYAGFESCRKKSSHTLEQIHALIDEAVAYCASTWGWECAGLEVKFHLAGNALGLAYAPGTGAKSGVRKISLNAILLERYDAKSVRRVVFHELCHHFREERWPRPKGLSGANPHDATFCKQLSLVDPRVNPGDSKSCSHFADEADPSIVAAIDGKKAARIVAPVWDVAAGTVLLSRYAKGELKIEWAPNRAAGFKWTREVGAITAPRFVELLKRFQPSAWASVAVDPSACGAIFRGSPPTNLLELARYLTKGYPRIMQSAADYMQDAGVA